MPNLLSAATLNAILAFGVVLAGLGYLINQFMSGRRKSNQELIEDLTKQMQAQKEVIDSMQSQIINMTAEINHLKGLNEANEKKIQEYLQIITNRNPDLDKTLTAITGVIQDVLPFMKEMREAHAALRTQLDTLQPKGRRTTVITT
jgi:chromosome segregation ATPase